MAEMENTWVIDMEKKLDDAEPPVTVEKWAAHCIFRVPASFKMVHGSNVFKPQMVALGPFHHGDAGLRPMEQHKRRAVRHLLRRSGKALHDLAAAVEEVAGELEDMYAELGGEWRGPNRGRFLEMMIADGCFLLEVMRNHALRKDKQSIADYVPSDPVFGQHAIVHIGAFVQRDMLMIENQLPLRLLQKIVAAVDSGPSDDASINKQVLEFLCVDRDCATNGVAAAGLGLHPLQLYRSSLLRFRPTTAAAIVAHEGPRPGTTRRKTEKPPPRPPTADAVARRPAPRSARQLWEAGIRFRPSGTSLLDDVDFDERRRVVRMPRVVLDDSSECKLRNVMAFEALHAGPGPGAGDDVTAFVLFLRDMVDSAADVALLRDEKVLDHDLAGSDAAVAALLNRLTRDAVKTGGSRLYAVHGEVEEYCNDNWRVFVFRSWAKFKSSYLSSPWVFMALVITLLLVGTDITQTVYAVRTYELEARQHTK